MARFGWKLMCEQRSPRELIDQAIEAEGLGLEFVSISDHFHPWLPEHEHSPFAWSVLGAIAERTSVVQLVTGITCPVGRYEPAIVAQAAATVATMSGGRLTLGVGAGERLNEHVTGRPFPPVEVRHERLGEAIEAMRALWSGEFTSYRGEHVTVEDARVYDLPGTPIPVVVGVSGPASLDLARDHRADGIMATEPEASLIDGWEARGGSRRDTWTEVPFAYASTEQEGLDLVWERMRFTIAGWKVMSELPNPVNFDAAAQPVPREVVGRKVPHGPDPAPYIEAVRSYLDAGFEHLAVMPVGDDVAGTFRFWEQEVRPALETARVPG
jgi:G6PDH family F420-dependent oxidoreductase